MSDSMLFLFGAILLFVVLKLLFGKNNAAGQPYKYVLNKTLFTPAERFFSWCAGFSGCRSIPDLWQSPHRRYFVTSQRPEQKSLANCV